MAKSVQKITLSSSRDIPFDKLLLGQSNVRHVKAGVSIEELAEDIVRRGLLMGLSVRAVVALRKPLAEFTDEEYDSVMDTNLRGVFNVLREAARRMADGGRIVNTSASFHGAPIPGYGVYAPSKWAIEKMTEVAAKELGARGIRVNAIRPGPTDTPLFRDGKDENAVKMFANMAALGRIGTPEDIGRVVSFLVGPDGEWVTAQILGANGGYW